MSKFYSRLASALALVACLSSSSPASAYDFEGGKLYGFALKTGSYTMTSNRYYSFDLGNPATAATPLSTEYMSYKPTVAATVLNDKFICVDGSSFNKAIYTLDLNDSGWSLISYKTLSGCNMIVDMTSLNGEVYGWIQPYIGAGWQLGKIDMETGAVSAIGSEQSTRLVAITSDFASKMYGLDAAGNFYEISLTDSSLSRIGSIGKTTSTSTYQSATFDSATGSVIWVHYDDSSFNTTSTVYSINTATAKASSLGNLSNYPQLIGLYTPVSFNSKAPGEVTGLEATNDGVSNDIKVTFNVPVKNYGGEDMAANITGLKYTIKVDGETKIDAKSTTRGAAVSETIASTPGSHTVSVYVSQTTYGDGPEVKCNTFVGMDTPGAATDVVLKADGNDITLTWTAPKGANGGKYDESKLTYTVTRMPGDVEVATGLTDTKFTETLQADKLAPYSYKVTVVYEGNSTGLTTASNVAYAGPVFAVTADNTYFKDFQDCTTGDDTGFFCTSDTPMQMGEPKDNMAIGIATDGDNKYLTFSQADGLRTTNPRLFTTGLRLKGRHTYKVSMKFKAGSSLGATFAVVMTDSPTADANIKKTIINSTSYGFYTTDQNWQNFTDDRVPATEFTVDEDGVYYISLQGGYTTNAWHVDDFKVEDITAPGVPMSASELTATPDAEGSRNISISFCLPTEDSNGDDPALTKAELRRGNDVINTWTEGLTPGSKLTFSDQNAPLGLNTYSVVVSNANGDAPAVSANAIAGRNYDLKLQNVEAPETVVRGKTIEIKATVINNGAVKAPVHDESSYAVSLVQVLSDGSRSIAATQNGVLLAPDESHDYEFNIATGSATPDKVTYYVSVAYDEDQFTDDNLSDEFTIDIVSPELTAVSDLSVTTTDGANVLTWTAPEFDSELMTLTGYDVYCDNVKVNDAVVTETTFTHTPDTEGSHSYYVITVYNNGNSAPSNTVIAGDTAIGSIDAADANDNAEYYTIQGVRVMNPSAGNVYIRRQGNNVSKVIIL